MTTTETLRKQAIKYINNADENSLRRVNAILEIDQNSNEWWKDKQFLKELDKMDEAMESGEDKGVTFSDIERALDIAIKEADNGKGRPHEDVWAEIRKRYKL